MHRDGQEGPKDYSKPVLEAESSGESQNGNSEALNIERGVRQGCVLSPKLFNLYTEPIFRVLKELPGLSVWGGGGGGNINNFRYADDTDSEDSEDSEEKLQKIVNKVKEQSENLRLFS